MGNTELVSRHSFKWLRISVLNITIQIEVFVWLQSWGNVSGSTISF